MQETQSLQGCGDEGARHAFKCFSQCNRRAILQRCMSLFERNSASKNWINSADKITENHADFIIAVTGDSIRSELRTLLESV